MVQTKSITLIIQLTLFLLLTGFVPQKKNQKAHINDALFYIERSCNKNTVVYEANFDKDGQLNKTNPIRAYWIMHEKNGEIESLNMLEQKFAYGIKVLKHNTEGNEFDIRMVSTDDIILKLKQTSPHSARVFYSANNKEAPLHHMYVNASNNGLWSKVKNIKLYTSDITSKQLKTHLIEL